MRRSRNTVICALGSCAETARYAIPQGRFDRIAPEFGGNPVKEEVSAMIGEEIGERLALARTAWYSSVRPDGSPHTVPVWFMHDEVCLWVASSHRAARWRT